MELQTLTNTITPSKSTTQLQPLPTIPLSTPQPLIDTLSLSLTITQLTATPLPCGPITTISAPVHPIPPRPRRRRASTHKKLPSTATTNATIAALDLSTPSSLIVPTIVPSTPIDPLRYTTIVQQRIAQRKKAAQAKAAQHTQQLLDLKMKLEKKKTDKNGVNAVDEEKARKRAEIYALNAIKRAYNEHLFEQFMKTRQEIDRVVSSDEGGV